jgi:Tfp pilus assembly protein PilN
MGDINMIPADRLAKKHQKARLRLWTLVCGVYFIFLVVFVLSGRFFWGGYNDPITEEIKSTAERIESYSSTIQQLQEKLAKATAELQACQAISCRPNWSKLLVLLSGELGEEVVLGNCQIVILNKGRNVKDNLREFFSSSDPAALLAERRYKLELSGYGRTQTAVSQFVLRLERMRIFDSVRLINSYRGAFLKSEAVAFSIECSI